MLEQRQKSQSYLKVSSYTFLQGITLHGTVKGICDPAGSLVPAHNSLNFIKLRLGSATGQ